MILARELHRCYMYVPLNLIEKMEVHNIMHPIIGYVNLLTKQGDIPDVLMAEVSSFNT